MVNKASDRPRRRGVERQGTEPDRGGATRPTPSRQQPFWPGEVRAKQRRQHGEHPDERQRKQAEHHDAPWNCIAERDHRQRAEREPHHDHQEEPHIVDETEVTADVLGTAQSAVGDAADEGRNEGVAVYGDAEDVGEEG